MNFQTYILTHYPIWQWGTIFLVITCFIQLALNFIVDKCYSMDFLEKYNEITVNIFQVIGSIAAILYGLLVFLVLNNFQTVQSDINDEANSAGNLFRNLLLVDKPQQMQPIQDLIYEYINNDLNNEFTVEHLGSGHSIDFQFKGWDILEQISKKILNSPDISTDMRNTLLENLDGLFKSRRLRINEETLALPSMVWNISLFSMLIMLINVALIGCENKNYRKVYSMLFAISLGLIIILIFEIDRPFNGEISVSDKYFRDLIINMNHKLKRD